MKYTDTAAIETLAEFDNHRLFTTIIDQSVGLKAYVAIHRGGIQKPAFGATRFWKYDQDIDALRDALKLARIMTYKSALAGLPYGGAKAVIMLPATSYNRSRLLRSYARSVNYLSGHFITGADVGISAKDVHLMAKESKDMVGLSCDPVRWTITGLLYGIRTSLKELFGTDSFSGRTFAIQGLGKTGLGLLPALAKEAKTIYVSDIDGKKIQLVKTLFPMITPVSIHAIHKSRVDIFSPCALSNAITRINVDHLQCKAVVGSANSQLENPEVGILLHKRNILYAPDYVVNAGGLMSVTDEYEHGNTNDKRLEAKVRTIATTLTRIIEKSKQQNTAVSEISDHMAQKIAKSFT